MSAPLRILLLDASSGFRERLGPLLHGRHAPCVLDWLSLPQGAAEAIGAAAHDFYLVDYRWGPTAA